MCIRDSPETAEQLGVSISSVVRFRRLHRETGSISPAKAYPLYPPNLAGLMLPVSRCSLRKRTTELILTPSCSAVSGMVAPSCPVPTTRARRSSEYGFAIHAGLHSSTNLESDSFPQGNPAIQSFR